MVFLEALDAELSALRYRLRVLHENAVAQSLQPSNPQTSRLVGPTLRCGRPLPTPCGDILLTTAEEDADDLPTEKCADAGTELTLAEEDTAAPPTEKCADAGSEAPPMPSSLHPGARPTPHKSEDGEGEGSGSEAAGFGSEADEAEAEEMRREKSFEGWASEIRRKSMHSQKSEKLALTGRSGSMDTLDRGRGSRQSGSTPGADNTTPGNFEVVGPWQAALNMATKHESVFSNSLSGSGPSRLGSTFIADDDSDAGDRFDVFSAFIVQPNTMKRLSWDIFGIFLILYDVAWMPLMLLDPPYTDFTLVMEWTARIYFTSDIFASFITGQITNEGTCELRLHVLARRYARTWLLFDVALVTFDWIEVLLNSSSIFSHARLTKVMRTLRVFRVVRLARLLKLPGILDMLMERVLSEEVIFLMRILKITACIVAFVHCVACVWFRVGTGGAQSWVADYGYTDVATEYKYVVSFHWAITQFVGSMQIHAQNPIEHFYAVLVLLTSFVVSAGFVSSITTTMTRLTIIDTERSTRFSMLRRYLGHHDIPRRLAMRVTRNANHAVQKMRRDIAEEDVVVLSLLSDPLRMELHFEMHSRVLKAHPLLASYCVLNPASMRNICHRAVSVLSVAKHDVVFSAGERPAKPQMFFIVGGGLSYLRESVGPVVTCALGEVGFDIREPEWEDLEAPEWVCEQLLWSSWVHRGSLRSTMDSTVLLLDAEQFQENANRFFDSRDDAHPARYADWFVDNLNDLEVEQLTDLDPCFGLSHRKNARSYPQWLNTALGKTSLWQAPSPEGMIDSGRISAAFMRTFGSRHPSAEEH